ncbi:L,D-transpeptidase family protein [Xanthocytophaga agilis]|uniref:L,D-transpeptidase family protein n=1 Tax=Xanthocytophaga agilis TaxID=3048010 RepID=A0AAE3QYA2_9BACT|nr:L,D-transpeptidase family protein [Xanthocytophaga agilis]MDJ1500321.1 L,D-transpeptidase family protein [Xanthocytophaga agilis]
MDKRNRSIFLVVLATVSLFYFYCKYDLKRSDILYSSWKLVQNPFQSDSIQIGNELVSQYIQQLLDTAHTYSLDAHSLDSLPVQTRNLQAVLADFYQKRGWQPIWSSNLLQNTAADSVIVRLYHPEAFGLLSHFYRVSVLEDLYRSSQNTTQKTRQAHLLAQWDIHFTESLLLFTADLANGRINSTSLLPVIHTRWICEEGMQRLEQVIEDLQWEQYFQTCQPSMPLYKVLQHATARFVQMHQMDTASFSFRTLGRDSLQLLLTVKQALTHSGWQVNFPDTLPIKQQYELIRPTLQLFQQSHGLELTGKPDKTTLAVLGRNNWQNFLQLCINLERLRWDNLQDSSYLLINIPEYELRLYQADSILLSRRLIVGKPDSPTPILSSAITYFVIAPEWNVPRSIVLKEMLPRIQNNRSFLSDNHLMMLDQKSNVIDPYTLDWNKITPQNFPYTIRQQSGCDNALGNIIFHFPNKYSFYLHDTPARKLFDKVYRALSHSCMRMEDPAELATYLLKREHSKQMVTRQLIEQCQLKRERRQYILKSPFPIHIRYYTCGVKKNSLCYYPDIYQKDKALLSLWNQPETSHPVKPMHLVEASNVEASNKADIYKH